MRLETSDDRRMDRSVMVAVCRPGEAPPPPRIEVVRLRRAPDLPGVHHPAAMARLGADSAAAAAFPGAGDRAHLLDERRIGVRRLGHGVVARPCGTPRPAPPFWRRCRGAGDHGGGRACRRGTVRDPALTTDRSSACCPTNRSGDAIRASWRTSDPAAATSSSNSRPPPRRSRSGSGRDRRHGAWTNHEASRRHCTSPRPGASAPYCDCGAVPASAFSPEWARPENLSSEIRPARRVRSR